MKFSVSSYSYSKLTSSGEYTEKELISLAKEMGFDGIEFAEIHTPEGADKEEYAASLKAEAERAFKGTQDSEEQKAEAIKKSFEQLADLGKPVIGVVVE